MKQKRRGPKAANHKTPLAKWLRANDIAPNYLAVMAGINVASLSHYVQGVHIPPVSRALKIVNWLNANGYMVAIEELFEAE